MSTPAVEACSTLAGTIKALGFSLSPPSPKPELLFRFINKCVAFRNNHVKGNKLFSKRMQLNEDAACKRIETNVNTLHLGSQLASLCRGDKQNKWIPFTKIYRREEGRYCSQDTKMHLYTNNCKVK